MDIEESIFDAISAENDALLAKGNKLSKDSLERVRRMRRLAGDKSDSSPASSSTKSSSSEALKKVKDRIKELERLDAEGDKLLKKEMTDFNELKQFYIESFEEEYKPLPLDRMKKAARNHDLHAKAWDMVDKKRNSGISGLARKIARKVRGDSTLDKAIQSKKKIHSLKSKLIGATANMRLHDPEDFENHSKEQSARNKVKAARNSIRKLDR